MNGNEENITIHHRKKMLHRLKEVKEFLNKYRVKRGEPYTNTGMNNDCLKYGNFNFNGSFCVPDDEYESFLEHIYRIVFEYEIPLGLTERHLDTLSPIVIDLDFRYKQEYGVERQHTQKQILTFIKLYHTELTDVIDLHEHQKDKFRYFILERPDPRLDESKGVVKDGVHIVCPDLQLPYSILFMIREFVIKKMGSIFEDKKFNEIQPFSECFDKSVIRDSNWMIHGNTKKGVPAYELNSICFIAKDNKFGKIKIKDNRKYNDRNLIKLLSIRNNIVGGSMRIRDKWQRKVDIYTKKINKRSEAKPANTFTNTNNQIINHPDGTLPQFLNTEKYEFVKSLVACLSAERAQPYSSWIKVGWCLRNIAAEFGIPDRFMFSLWISFSRKSPNYNEGAEHREYWFERFWNQQRDNGPKLTLGSLRYWANEDNPVEYEKIRSIKVNKKIDISALNRASHVSTSDFIYELTSDRFICTLGSSKSWYVFKEDEHRWVEDKGNHYLYNIITRKGVNYVTKRIREIEDKFYREAEQNDIAVNMKDLDSKRKPYTDLCLKLQDMNYFDKLVKACGHKLYDSKFYENLDSNPNLICFTNGVLDLSTGEFRDGKPDDFISQTTGYEFNPETDPLEKEELMGIFTQILPHEDVREYFLTILASCLRGGNKDQSFYILQNSRGANGKTLLMELMLKAFGNQEDGYGNKFNVAILLEKRASGAGAHPEMAKLRGKRFTYCEEPDEDKPINTGLLKELTGGGSLTTRALYKDPITFEIQTKFMMCCNDLPRINADDDGTWRRLKNVYFPSRFLHVDSEDYKIAMERGDPHIYPRDDTLKDRLEELKGTFMSILFDYYMKYIFNKNSIIVPGEVLKASKDYQEEQDVLRSWIQQNIEVRPESHILIRKLHEKFCSQNREIKNKYSKTKLYKKIIDIFQRDIQNGNIIDNKRIGRLEGIGFRDNSESQFGEDI
jgi:P4 family phage/plasmid primase-like protien